MSFAQILAEKVLHDQTNRSATEIYAANSQALESHRDEEEGLPLLPPFNGADYRPGQNGQRAVSQPLKVFTISESPSLSRQRAATAQIAAKELSSESPYDACSALNRTSSRSELLKAVSDSPFATSLKDTLVLETAGAGSIHIYSNTASPLAAPRAQRLTQTDLILDFDEEETKDGKGTKKAKKSRLAAAAIPLLVSLLLLALGIFMLSIAPKKRWMYLEVWRWLCFVAGFAPVYYLSDLVVHGILVALEDKFFTITHAIYFVVAMKGPTVMLLRMLLLIPLFVVAFADGVARPDDVQAAYGVALKVLVCLALCASGSVVNVLLAKLLAAHFHRKAFFEKMQDALNKEYFLHELSQPRPKECPNPAALAIPSSNERQALEVEMSGQSLGARMRRARSVGQALHSMADTLRSKLHHRASTTGHSLAIAAHSEASSFTSVRCRPQPDTGASTPTWAKSRHAGSNVDAAAPMDSSATRAAMPPLASNTHWAKRVAQLERHMRENKLRQHSTFADELGHAQTMDEVTSQKEARRLAFDIFWNTRSDFSRNYIVFEDLLWFLPADKALAALKVLDSDGDGKISPAEMRDGVLTIYKERKNLAASLQDTSSVVGKMEISFGCIIHFVLIFFYLTIFEVNVQQVWLSFSSVLLSLVFVFGNNIRMLYENTIFVLVIHPFDVGDVLYMNNDQWHQVEEISLQNTLVRRWDGAKIYMPNLKLSTEPIINISRSALRWEGFKVLVDISTPAEVFSALEQAVDVLFKSNPAEYTGDRVVVANGATDPLKYTLCVFWEFSHTGMELRRTSKGRHAVFMIITKTLIEWNVLYHLPPYPVRYHPEEPRPHGEGASFMPPFMQKNALKL